MRYRDVIANRQMEVVIAGFTRMIVIIVTGIIKANMILMMYTSIATWMISMMTIMMILIAMKTLKIIIMMHGIRMNR